MTKSRSRSFLIPLFLFIFFSINIHRAFGNADPFIGDTQDMQGCVAIIHPEKDVAPSDKDAQPKAKKDKIPDASESDRNIDDEESNKATSH